jgi:uncharacterized protein YndB with AHSA1/START domain
MPVLTTSLSEVNPRAPVVGACEVEIAASPDVVWDVLTQIDRWPNWNPAVESSSAEEGVEEGSRFRWKAGPGTIRSTIQDMEKPWRIAWTGTSFGIKAIHVHTFEPRDGKTVVRTEESYDGVVAHLFRRRLQRTLDRALQGELQHLKAEAERRESGT